MSDIEDIEDIIRDDFDKEYLLLLEEIESRFDTIKRHDLIRVTSWIKKLNQITSNKEWKRNRNLHALYLLDMILNNDFKEPYNKFPPEQHVPILSKTIVKSKLSGKFAKVLLPLEAKLNENASNHKSEKSHDDKKLDMIREEPRLTFTNENATYPQNNDVSPVYSSNQNVDQIEENPIFIELKSELEKIDINNRIEILLNSIEEKNNSLERVVLEKLCLEKLLSQAKDQVNIKNQETQEKQERTVKSTYNQTFGIKQDKKPKKVNSNTNNKLNRYRFI